jgi:hypothetical protein
MGVDVSIWTHRCAQSNNNVDLAAAQKGFALTRPDRRVLFFTENIPFPQK